MKKKLLIFIPVIGAYRIDYYNRLAEYFDTTIIYYEKQSNGSFYTEENLKKVTAKILYIKNNLSFFIKAIRLIRETSPEFILVSEFKLYVVLFLLYKYLFKKDFKLISQCDDSYNMTIEHNDFSIKHRIGRKLLMPFLDEVILVDNRLVAHFHKKWKKGFFFPIINDENIVRYNYQKALQEAKFFYHQHQLEGKNIFAYIGRLVPLKQIDFIISAFAQLDQKNNVLLIVGDGSERQKLQALAKEKSVNAIFTGVLMEEKLAAIYLIASFQILASRQEPFGAVTVEALMAGCRSIVSRQSGSACLIDRGNGWVFDAKNPTELAHILSQAQYESSELQLEQLRPNLCPYHFHDLMEELKERFLTL